MSDNEHMYTGRTCMVFIDQEWSVEKKSDR